MSLSDMTNYTERPMPPASLRVSHLSANSASIEWSKPLDNGGSPITNYTLEKRMAGQRNWEKLTMLPPDATECELQNMTSTKDYFIRIRADNKFGSSQPKELLEPIRVKGIQKGKS